MASIRKEILIDAPPDQVWDAVRDYGAVHERLVPGFVIDARLDGDDRIVTFFNGVTVREVLVDLDEAEHRLAWSIVDGPYEHHNGVAQVIEAGPGRTRFVWTTDLLPNELAERTDEMMARGLEAAREALSAAQPSM